MAPENVSSGGRKSGQKHQNTFTYKHNKASRLTKKILASPIEKVCRRCYEIIDWRKKFRKYKPLTAAKKCVNCDMKKVCEAYHIICAECAEKNGICAKCKSVLSPEDLAPREQQTDPLAVPNHEDSNPASVAAGELLVKDAGLPLTEDEYNLMLSELRERDRRSFLRKLEARTVRKSDLRAVHAAKGRPTIEFTFGDEDADEDEDDFED